MLCDAALHTYLSKVADTAEKRNYLHVLYAALDIVPVEQLCNILADDLCHILDLCPLTFQPCEYYSVLAMRKVGFLSDYFGNFLRNPERSRSFHCDPERWSALVAARYIRHLGIGCNPRCDIQFNGVYP